MIAAETGSTAAAEVVKRGEVGAMREGELAGVAAETGGGAEVVIEDEAEAMTGETDTEARTGAAVEVGITGATAEVGAGVQEEQR